MGDPKNIDWSVYDYLQKEQIKLGSLPEADVSIYTAPIYAVLNAMGMPVFNGWQMYEIRWGLEAGLDVSKYAVLDENGKPVFDWMQMREIRYGLEAGLDVSVYADPDFNWYEMAGKRRDLIYDARSPEKGASLDSESKEASRASQALDTNKDVPSMGQER